MLAELYYITGIAFHVCFMAIAGWLIVKIIQVKKYFVKIYMDDIDKILDQAVDQAVPQDNKAKERLIQVVASGRSKEYLGRFYSTDEIEKLDDKEVAKLYAKYEAFLGGQITSQLKQHFIYAYARAVEFLCPTVSKGRLAVYNTSQMEQSLNNGPFIDLALTSLTCKLYHEYGHFLAPFEAALLTSSFVQPAQLATQQTVEQNSTSYATNTASYQQANQQVMQRQAMQNSTSYAATTKRSS